MDINAVARGIRELVVDSPKSVSVSGELHGAISTLPDGQMNEIQDFVYASGYRMNIYPDHTHLVKFGSRGVADLVAAMGQ